MMEITGTWTLESWDRIDADGSTSNPFGSGPTGLLVYTPDGNMAVMMAAADRPKLDTDDPVGGSMEARAGAYSTCLAYVGRYRLDGKSVIHELETSLFPNWSGTQQVRPFVLDDKRLILQVRDADDRLTSEIAWRRRDNPGR
jgi:hypothetical protein